MTGSALPVRLRSLVRRSTPVVAHRSGLSRAIAQRYRGRGVIFMLHSVVDDDAFYPEAMLRCPAGRLDWILRWLKANGFAFVTLDEAIARLDQPQSAPFAAFTCDDGYADNLTHALPVMERHNAPFTVFVTTGMMTGEIDAWWLGLSRLIATRNSIELADKRFDCSDRNAKRRTFRVIESMIHANYALLPEVKRLIEHEWNRLPRACLAGGPRSGPAPQTRVPSIGNDWRAHNDPHRPGASDGAGSRQGDARQSRVSRGHHSGPDPALRISVRQRRSLRSSRGEDRRVGRISQRRDHAARHSLSGASPASS